MFSVAGSSSSLDANRSLVGPGSSSRSNDSRGPFRGAPGATSDFDRFFGVSKDALVFDVEGSLEKSTDFDTVQSVSGHGSSRLREKRSDIDDRSMLLLDLRRLGVLRGSKSGENPHNFGDPMGESPSNEASLSFKSDLDRFGVLGGAARPSAGFASNCDGMSTNIYTQVG